MYVVPGWRGVGFPKDGVSAFIWLSFLMNFGCDFSVLVVLFVFCVAFCVDGSGRVVGLFCFSLLGWMFCLLVERFRLNVVA